MHAEGVAQMAVLSQAVYAMGCICSIFLLIYYEGEIQAGVKMLLIVHALVCGFQLILTGLLLIGRPSGLFGKMTILQFLQLVAFFTGVIGGAMSMYGHNFWMQTAFGFHRPLYPTVLLFTCGVLEIVMLFVLLRAKESLRAMKREGDFPVAPLSTLLCGSGEDDIRNDNNDDRGMYIEDPYYGKSRKAKPTFQNKIRGKPRGLVSLEIPSDSYSSSSVSSSDSSYDDGRRPLIRGTVVPDRY